MHIWLEFAVAQPPARVLAGFTRELFLALAPPVPPVRLTRFDGCRTGDVVDIELALGLTRLRWTARITAHGEEPDGSLFFVDEGERLPPPLRHWRHRHLIRPAPGGGSLIVEDIEYGTGRPWLDRLLYPALWGQFWLRGPVYRRWFGEGRAAG